MQGGANKGKIKKKCICGANFYGASKHSGKYCPTCVTLAKKRKRPVINIIRGDESETN